ncbi:hypothetical protein ACFQH6_08920 [Halobacteriaceae archaeon GCM10025711]
MVTVLTWLRLGGYALGAFGSLLVFVEFFTQPNYVSFDADLKSYTIDMSPREVTEHTWLGRVGALLVAVAFLLEFVALFLAEFTAI